GFRPRPTCNQIPPQTVPPLDGLGRRSMVVFELAVLLAIASIAAFPCWRYSADWGYLPSAVSGVLLLVVMAVAVTDKGPDRLARPNGMCLVSSGQRSASPHCCWAWPRSRVSMRSVRVAGGLIATTRTP